jgi:hypothetical protein
MRSAFSLHADMNTGASAGPSRTRTPAPERIPFADQLANASAYYFVISSRIQRPTLSCPSSSVNAMKSPFAPPSRLPLGGIEAPQSKQTPNIRMEQITPSVLHEQVGNDSDDSDVPLAKKFLKRTKLIQDKEDAPQPPKKRRPRAKASGPAKDPSDMVTNPSKTTETLRRKVQTVADIPPPPITQEVDSGGGRSVQVLQEKTAPTNAPRKRKQRVRSAKDESEHMQGPPRKKRRRADATTRYAYPLFRFTSLTSVLRI